MCPAVLCRVVVRHFLCQVCDLPVDELAGRQPRVVQGIAAAAAVVADPAEAAAVLLGQPCK